MQKKQASGLDTRRMVPIYAAVFGIFGQLFLPWLSIPALKRSRLSVTYSLPQTASCVSNLRQWGSTQAQMTPLSASEAIWLAQLEWILPLLGTLLALLLLGAAVAVWRKRDRALGIVRVTFSLHLFWCVAQFLLVLLLNATLNLHTGQSIAFRTLTIQSTAQLTAWVYAQLLLALVVVIGAKRLLAVSPAESAPAAQVRKIRDDRRLGRRTRLSLVLLLLGIPLTILFGIYFLNDRSAVFIGLCIVCLSMLPFAMVFEDRRPQARELLLIAVLSAIAVAGRAAFFMLPQFKPMAAIVILAGVTLGPEAGFLTGTISGFVSNFFFGQGPWTPWQMFSFGIIGFLAGLLFFRRSRSGRGHRLVLCLYGGLSVLFLYGALMDLSGLISTYGHITWSLAAARLISGFPFNLIHAAATVFFLFILSGPMERKIRRIQQKYGLLQV